jgi:hypothetical protein
MKKELGYETESGGGGKDSEWWRKKQRMVEGEITEGEREEGRGQRRVAEVDGRGTWRPVFLGITRWIHDKYDS